LLISILNSTFEYREKKKMDALDQEPYQPHPQQTQMQPIQPHPQQTQTQPIQPHPQQTQTQPIQPHPPLPWSAIIGQYVPKRLNIFAPSEPSVHHAGAGKKTTAQLRKAIAYSVKRKLKTLEYVAGHTYDETIEQIRATFEQMDQLICEINGLFEEAKAQRNEEDESFREKELGNKIQLLKTSFVTNQQIIGKA
jgi:hypothetical protein